MTDGSGRTERPIERGFTIGRVDEITVKGSRAKQCIGRYTRCTSG